LSLKSDLSVHRTFNNVELCLLDWNTSSIILKNHGEAKVVCCHCWPGSWGIFYLVSFKRRNENFPYLELILASRLEAGQLVKGVPEALHQSFSTKEEAYCVFLQEQAKGNTKVVKSEKTDSQKRSTSTTTRTEPPHPSTDFNHRPSNVASLKNVSNMQRHFSQNTHGTPRAIGNSSKQSSFPSLDTYNLSHVSGTPSDPSLASYRRLRAMKMVYDSRHDYKRDIGTEAGTSPTQSVQSSTPCSRTSRNSSSSPSKWSSSSQSSRVVVKTPSWLASYPRNHQSNFDSLSPLNSAEIHLNSFSSNMVNIDDAPGCKLERLGLSPVRSPSGSPLGTGRTLGI